jgi:putative restriction endonuclease
MQGFVAVTDHDWFRFLSAQKDLDEVNFWQPGGPIPPKQLPVGAPVLLKLHKRDGGGIAGFGRFARFEPLPVWLAWEAFEHKNGLPDFRSFCKAIDTRRAPSRHTGPIEDHVIGCLMLSTPIFLPLPDAVEPPHDWSDNIVRGKYYDLADGEGARIWSDLQSRLRFHPAVHEHLPPGFPAERYGEPMLVRPRLGQGIFRVAVTVAYDRACAVTGEHSLPALEAAHIKPFGEGGEHAVPNGLLMRSDLHRLFDKGYVGVAPERAGDAPEYRFLVSRRLRDDFENGRSYYPLHGRLIHLPAAAGDQPDPAALEWHLNARFRG